MNSAILSNYGMPSLSYKGAIDITSAEYGSTMYYFYYDASLVSLGSVLMFEIKTIQTGLSVDPSNVELSFISTDNASNTGISNQWQISVPSTNYDYDADPDVSVKIQMRVYIGVRGTSEVAVSEWSNELDVHSPPKQPIIAAAYYDSPSINNDDLYIFFDPSSNIYGYPNYFTDLKFVAAFYYQDASTNLTVWDVSMPLDATEVTYGTYNGTYMVHVPEFGVVSTNIPVVYVSIYAVYEFQDSSNNNYYSVSQISDTFNATSVNANDNPTITGIDYAVYDPSMNQAQTMNVHWIPPNNSSIPTFQVDYYNVYFKTDPSDNYILAPDGGNVQPSLDPSYNLDVSNVGDYPCGTTVYFMVEAVSTNGTISPPSDDTELSRLNVFYYSDAPTGLEITDTSFDASTNVCSMFINFVAPVDKGCGFPHQFVINILDNSEIIQATIYEPYDPSDNNYVVYFSSYTISQFGTVQVSLQTFDTNPTEPMDVPVFPNDYPLRTGADVTISYLIVNFDLNSLDYTVYSDIDRPQDMILSWNDPALGGWTTTNYMIEYQAISPETEVPGPDLSWNYLVDLSGNFEQYTYDAADNGCNTTMFFRVTGTVENGPIAINVISNYVSKNIFRYATAPQNVSVLWASADGSFNYMDVRAEFQNPQSIGCGSDPYFVVNVLDGSGNILTYYDSSENATQVILYDSSSNLYTVNFNDVTYSYNGSVEVYMVTTDTNSTNLENGPLATAVYNASRLPIYRNVVMDPSRNILTFEVITQSPLVQTNSSVTGQAVGLPPVAVLTEYPWRSGDPGVSVIETLQPNYERLYSIIFDNRVPGTPFPDPFPFPFGLLVSNTDAGIASYNVDAPN
jgi:hypothetical protein